MDIVRSATRVVTGAANATTAAAGALGGATVNGIIGGVQGTARGVREGVSSGSHSTPAALLAMGAIGAAGLIEWPALLMVGGTALLVQQLAGPAQDEAGRAAPTPRQASSASMAKKAPPRKSSARKKS
ncbi:hypothetical protein [Mycobacterium deserti]|uniref:Transmembrane protein n=1 Tax=Mycobacterium deserti TaxID=2978347 RepID=A0ABT2MH28_9MYCO|nr:hypothetical protein [Mycobacterium deserti]MCT7660834.1 hypothetical protein [Mycobacterium deserti]